MTLHLRDYQLEAVEAVQAAAERGVRRPLVALPTGTGKTVVFSELIRRRGGRALVIAHRDELLEQARDKLRVVDPDLRVGVVQGGRDEHDAPVVVASIQTLSRERRMARLLGRGAQAGLFPTDPFTTVVIDEAHHAAAPTYRAAIAQLGGFDLEGGPLVVGVTATPERSDGVGLQAVFEEIVYRRELLDMIRAGYLCDIRAVRVHVELNLDNLKVRAGDFGDEELGRALIESAAPEHALTAYQQHAAGRKALIFAPTVEVAQLMAGAFTGAGIASRWVSGETPRDERAATLAAFRAGEVQVLANCMILTEGYDEPSVDCLIMARPTKSRPLYVQMVGRGTRRAPGKADCLVIDLLGNSRRHQLMTVASLAGLDPDDLTAGRTVAAAVAEREAQEEGAGAYRAGGQVVGEAVDLFAESELSWSPAEGLYVLSGGEHGQVVIRQGEADAWSVTVLPPRGGPRLLGERLDLGYAQGIAEDWVRQVRADRLADRSAAWRSRPASDRQVALLRERGVEVQPGLTSGDASALIDVAKAASALAPATPKQIWRLQQMGIATSAGLTKREASALIDDALRRRGGGRVRSRA
jgi:superfamily II DNA or RNA helicase